MGFFKKMTQLGLGVWAAMVVSSGFLAAQTSLETARAHLERKADGQRFDASDFSEMTLSSRTFLKTAGIENFYFQQKLAGIEVHNAIFGVHFKAGEVLKESDRFVPFLAEKANSRTPKLSAQEALRAAAVALGYGSPQKVAVQKKAEGDDRKTVFKKGNLSLEDIPVRLVWQPTEKAGVRLCWQVEIEEPSGQNHWLARIDAATGELLGKDNYTVQCAFDHPKGHEHGPKCVGHDPFEAEKAAEKALESELLPPPPPSSYNVFGPPTEAPSFGGRSVLASPEDLAASPFGWHDTNGADGAEFTTTQGNNVHAYTDTNGDNAADAGSSPDGTATLTFNFPLDLTMAPLTNSNAAVTNLFFWNNYLHDFSYRYGFDEANGNFQVNNYGNGGTAGDDVRAEALDRAANAPILMNPGQNRNNANFNTPPDGSRPRMQMFIWTTAVPNLDGDYDNGVIAHEYAHGISNRFTGGPATTSCLDNIEQMGEGWSDFYALMTTFNGSQDRGIGTYVLNQATTGGGIRPTVYSRNMATNSDTYDDIKTRAIPHGIGYVWCTMLWDLTLNLIDVHGMGTGFDLAVNLVNTGMALQPCSPGFVDGRDAILAADAALTGGANECLIWQTFARRGLGFSANQGSSNSRADGTEAFDMPPGLGITAICKNITVDLDALGTVTIAASDLNNGSTSSCGAMTFSTPQLNFDCTDLGPNPVVLTVSAGGISKTCNAQVTVRDLLNPIIQCKNIDLFLNAAGQATLNPSNALLSATDNCTVLMASLTASKTAFSCVNLGPNPVILSINDQSNNVGQCIATITVIDNIPPMVTCMNASVALFVNENGLPMPPATVILSGPTDNCTVVSTTVAPNIFTCAQIGMMIPVVVTATDQSGNSANCAATVEVLAPPSTFSVADKMLAEGSPSGSTNFPFVVSRTNPKCAAAVDFSTADGTAFSPEDFTAAAGTLNFAANVSSQTATILVKKDNKIELDETFDLNLSNPVNGSIGDGSGLGTVQNDDVATIQISNVSTSEGNIGLKNVTFTATILKAADVPVSFDFSTSDGTATVADNDYLPLAAATATIPAGLLSKTFSIQAKGDTKPEGNETVNVAFSNVQAMGRAVTLAQASRTATLSNDDGSAMAGPKGDQKTEKGEVGERGNAAEKALFSTEIAVFPNPTDGFLNVLLEKGEWQITVFDLVGKALFAQKANLADGELFQIDASEMPVGVHFLKAQNLAEPEKTATLRWVKMD